MAKSKYSHLRVRGEYLNVVLCSVFPVTILWSAPNSECTNTESPLGYSSTNCPFTGERLMC